MTVKEEETQAELSGIDRKGHIKIDWGRQGGVILAYVVALLGYYGIIVNTVMYDDYGNWVSFTNIINELDLSKVEIYERSILCNDYGLCHGEWIFWTYTTYLKNYFLAPLLLFFICFLLTYKEDIPHYGIKASIWLVPLIIAEGFIFYNIMFGFSSEPFILKFTRIEGYVDIIILFGLAISGAIGGMKAKQYMEQRKSI